MQKLLPAVHWGRQDRALTDNKLLKCMLSSGILSGHFEIVRQGQASCHIFCWLVFFFTPADQPLNDYLYGLQTIVHETLKDLEANLWSSILYSIFHILKFFEVL